MSETPVIEDQVEKVRLVGEGVTVVPDDGRETAEVESELVPSYDLRSALYLRRIHRRFVLLFVLQQRPKG